MVCLSIVQSELKSHPTDGLRATVAQQTIAGMSRGGTVIPVLPDIHDLIQFGKEVRACNVALAAGFVAIEQTSLLMAKSDQDRNLLASSCANGRGIEPTGMRE
jgi:hypothetical protein